MRVARIWRLWFFATVLVMWWVLSAGSRSTFFPPLQKILTQLYELWIVGDARRELWSSLGHFARELICLESQLFHPAKHVA